MNRQQAIELVKQTFEAPFEHGRYIRFLRELLNGFDDEGARVNQGARIPEKFQEYVEKLERVGKYVSGGSEILLFIVYLKRETSIERARTMQRNFIAWYLSQGNKDDALVAFVSPNSVDWRFSLVKMDYRFEEQDGKTKVKEEFTPARRWSFLVGANEKSHTAQSKFVPILEDDENNPTLAGLEEAFNIEPVTKEFFKTFREIFEEAEAAIDRPWSAEQKRLYTQRFFNRLLFIVFLERKGWLSFGGRAGLSDSEIRTETTGRDATAGLDTVGRTPTYSTSGVRKDYLRALFEDYYQNQKDKNANFHRSRLNTLFFMGLNYPGGDKRSDPAYKPILSLIGDVPYLNGGLFEQEEDDKDGPTFPDAVIAKVLKDLVYQFNFTVTESTPLDVEVAVDPEMLGRIFEELVTGRHESGSYYTPKPVVQFMCREALKGYLVGRNSIPPYAESAEAIARFVDQNDAKSIRNPMQVLDALRAVKVCDPACGSGAYLLGMLHELLEQYTAIFAGHQKDAPTLYQTKLDIIQNNLYGVDKDNFAVNIARLRLWLSLIVDYEGATPPPLPNLDFKIECGDSLTAPDPSGGLQPDMFRQQQVQEFLRLKNEFMGLHAGSAAKRKKAQEIEKLKEEIKEWAHPRAAKFISPDDSFDWQVEFAEVFAPELATPTPSVPAGHLPQIPRSSAEFGGGQGGGFDIVLANPPYVRQELLGDYKNLLKPIYPEVYSGMADLYVYFYARAHQLLRNGGVSCFISSNKWLRAGYGEKLRQHLLDKNDFRLIVDFGDLPVFQSAIAYPCIFLWQKSPRENNPTSWAVVTNLDTAYADGLTEYVQKESLPLPASQFGIGKARIAKPSIAGQQQKMEKSGSRLGKLVNGQIYFGVKTGLNKAFIIDEIKRQEIISDAPVCNEIIKPIFKAENIKRYETHFSNKYLIWTYIGVDSKKYSKAIKYLGKFRKQLEERSDKGEQWYELRPCAYYDIFNKPKIVYPDIAPEVRFFMDEERYFIEATAFALPTNDYYLLGVLNSSSAWAYLTQIVAQIQNGYVRFKTQYLENLPIPDAPQKERDAVASLAKQAQSLHTQRRARVEAFLREIGLEPAQSTSRNPLETPWALGEDEFLRRVGRRSELIPTYRQAREETLSLTEETGRVEREIDERVKALYGL